MILLLGVAQLPLKPAEWGALANDLSSLAIYLTKAKTNIPKIRKIKARLEDLARLYASPDIEIDMPTSLAWHPTTLGVLLPNMILRNCAKVRPNI
ncbi:hypothetical protein NHP214376_06020 [Helicobacter ailurogastricus]|nr:hypothetical protein NHP214376_06020 [Helicobacter ailurogastricus]GLH58957.1 hypothetical protein NHP214377_02210 [Helicobacter ailurogastricus]